MRGDEEFAGEGGFDGAAAERFEGGEVGEIRIVVFLGDVGEDEMASAGIESVGIGEELADGVVGEVAGAGKDSLFDDPRVRTDLEHVQIVIGFEDHAVGFAKVDFDHFGEIPEVGADGDFAAVGTKGETDGIGGIVRNGEGVYVDVTDREMLAGLDGFDTFEALPESFGKDAL